MLLVTGPVVIFSSYIGKIYTKTGPKLLLSVGFLFFILSTLVQFFLTPKTPILPLIAALSFGIAWVIAWGPSITSALSSIPRDSVGLASGAFTTVQEIGGTLGLTIAGTAFRVEQNFVHGIWVLLFCSLLGLICSMGLRKKA